ncbi:MAG TPA: YbaY family lipoprotein [Candidatus Limnocylindrales bacterium]|nr:YbaY family lipoprotein [Candidatus Limnocylindrales bacterium]
MRRIESLLVAVVLLVALLPMGTAVAAGTAVTGTLETREKLALSGGAVAVVTLVDQAAAGNAGTIIGQQRIAGAQFPVSFSVGYDAAVIDPQGSYALFASIVDGSKTYESVEPVPVITGGPTSGVAVTVYAQSPEATDRVAGTMTRNDKSALGPEAVAIAALIRQDTGTMVARQVIPSVPSGAVPFSIAFDPSVIDPGAIYVVRGGIVDDARRWGAGDGQPGIVNGEPVPAVTLALTQVAGPAATPKPTAAPTAPPKPTAAPTERPKPTPRPTAAPTATPKPTAAPTATPKPTAAPTATPTPTPEPTPTPTPTPEPTPTPTPVATPTPAPTATIAPTIGVIRGQLTFTEDHDLTADATAIVALVEGTAGPQAGTIVASQVISPPGDEPVAFELLYPLDTTSPDRRYFLWAGITDGDLAWVTPIGVAVKAPWPLTEGIDLPLKFRPDLLKAAVSGSIAGVGLDSARDPKAYGTALIVRVDTGETVGFQLISPAGAAPIPFSVPYDPTLLDPNADYVVRGSVWDGTVLWAAAAGVPVITRDNATSNVVVTVTAVERPVPTAAPSPAASPSPVTPDAGDGGPGVITFLVILGLAVLGVGAVLAFFKSRKSRA